MSKKRAQGLSITTVIVAILALIVIVVIVAMLTGKIGLFGAGAEKALGCENACKALGRVYQSDKTEDECKDDTNGIIPLGEYPKIQPPSVCCCKLP